MDSGGWISKEREMQKHLEQTKLVREQCQMLRQQTLSALVVQEFFRGRREALAARSVIHKSFVLVMAKIVESLK